MKTLGYLVYALLQTALTAWGVLAIYFSALPVPVRYGGAAFFAAASVVVLLLIRPRMKGAVIFWAMFAGFCRMAGHLTVQPAQLAAGRRRAALCHRVRNDITVHNIRNIDYQTENDYTIHYHDKSFSLSSLSSFDVFMCDWGMGFIVHTMVSFGFADGSYLCVSIETRKETGETYSTLKGFFRQYELIYVVADERDLIRLRTNLRQGETVYLYRVQDISQTVIQQVFWITSITSTGWWKTGMVHA